MNTFLVALLIAAGLVICLLCLLVWGLLCIIDDQARGAAEVECRQ